MLAAPGALGLAGALVPAPAHSGERSTDAPAVAAAGVSSTADGEQVVAEITDPEASAAAMTAAFAEQGHDITVVLVSADPEPVGTVVTASISDWGAGDVETVGSREGCTHACGAPCTTPAGSPPVPPPRRRSPSAASPHRERPSPRSRRPSDEKRVPAAAGRRHRAWHRTCRVPSTG